MPNIKKAMRIKKQHAQIMSSASKIFTGNRSDSTKDNATHNLNNILCIDC